MDTQRFNQIISTGDPVSITPEFLDAARDNAHRLRSQAMMQGVRWISDATGAAFLRVAPLVKRAIAGAVLALATLVGMNNAQAEVPAAEIVASFNQQTDFTLHYRINP